MYEKEELADMLLDTGTIEFRFDKPFTRGTGHRMPVGENPGRITGYRERMKIANALYDLLFEQHLSYDIITATTHSMPLATTVANKAKKPITYFIPHTGHRHMVGEPPQGKRVLVVEGFIFSGKSEAILIDEIRKRKGSVVTCAALMDYDFPDTGRIFSGEAPYDGDRRLSQPCGRLSVLTFNYVVGTARDEGRISGEQADSLNYWRADRFGWGEQYGFPRVTSSKS
jgi:orotate phosphoribosyltransferase